MSRHQLHTADFGPLTVFYRYNPPEPADMSEDGYSRGTPPQDASIEIERVVSMAKEDGADITDALTTMFADSWHKLETELLNRHAA